MRKQMMLQYHDSTTEGGHSSAEDTFAKLARVCWWPGMKQQVERWVSTCSVCRLTKPARPLSTSARTELYQRPFRTIMIDAFGPIVPAVDGKTWVFQALCPFSKWTWLSAEPDNEASTWARFLVEDVFFDLAGFPVVLRTDRAKAFTSQILAEINDRLKITHAFGTSYHPQSQGAIEAAHKRPTYLIRAYVQENPHTWPRWLKLAQWVMRATPRRDLAGLSPYEMITGLRPQGPFEALLQRREGKALNPTSYIEDLRERLLQLKTVADTHAEKEQEQKVLEQRRNRPEELKVGDHVFLERPPELLAHVDAHGSRRLAPRAAPTLYFVKKMLGPSTAVLGDVKTREEASGIHQPVAVTRLRLFELADLAEPIGQPLMIEVREQMVWRRARILEQSAEGLVKLAVERDGTTTSSWVDLAKTEYRWT
jgi:hypothetical protein